MNHVTILAANTPDGPDPDGRRALRLASGEYIRVQADDIVTVEDARDPLPTEPGSTFRGVAPGNRSATEPLQWLITHPTGESDVERITYVSERCHEWAPADADRYGLRVVPETAP